MLKTIIQKIISNKATRLIEDNPEEYFLYVNDSGYYNNGVGFAPCGPETNEYDEERAYRDAKEKILEDIDDLDFDIFIENEEFVKAFKQMIERL